ncbi:MAG: hypothetical protein ACP5GX_11620, partial [Anaerolineae bacterium]
MKDMRCYLNLVWLIIFLIALGCGGIGLAYEQDLTADYAVWATDHRNLTALVQKEPQSSSAAGVISPMVFA